MKQQRDIVRQDVLQKEVSTESQVKQIGQGWDMSQGLNMTKIMRLKNENYGYYENERYYNDKDIKKVLDEFINRCSEFNDIKKMATNRDAL